MAGVTVTFDRLTDLSPAQVYGLLRLRSEVFVVEQNCVFLDPDGADLLPETVHVLAGSRPDAYARVLPVGFPAGPATRPDARSIGRVVTAASVRGLGRSSAVLVAIVERYGHEPLTLSAQARLETWYETFGFARLGPNFDEDGIDHVPMLRAPSSAQPPALGRSAFQARGYSASSSTSSRRRPV